MRGLVRIFVGALALLAGAAQAEPPWKQAGDRLVFPLGKLSLPVRAGTVAVTETGEASHPGEALDNVAQYASPDKAVFATIYVYYPGLPHAGLAAVATDSVIHQNSPKVTGGTFRSVAAGGTDGTALRADYEGYRTGLTSIAAFLKRDRWIVAIRVSGPPERRSEVEAAAKALLDGVKLEGGKPPRPLKPLALSACPEAGPQIAAKLLPDDSAKMAPLGMIGSFDGAGMDALDEASGKTTYLASRVPAEFCRASLAVKSGSLLLLRGADGDPVFLDGRTVLVVLMSDSGRLLEVNHHAKLGGYVLTYHDLGETGFLGTYDRIPSDAQLAAILSGEDREGTRIRVPVKLSPLRGPMITLPPLDLKSVPAPKPPAG